MPRLTTAVSRPASPSSGEGGTRGCRRRFASRDSGNFPEARGPIMKAIAVAAALLVAACATGSAAPAPSPGAPTQPPPATQSGPTVTPTAAPAATPLATQIGGVAAQIVPLGADSTPIDLVYAFGSIWVASHHYDAVIRLDPTTLAEIARIPVDDGPGWFAVT